MRAVLVVAAVVAAPFLVVAQINFSCNAPVQLPFTYPTPIHLGINTQISGDGSTIAASGVGDQSGHVFVKRGANVVELAFSGTSCSARYYEHCYRGSAVALSQDGSTIAVGAAFEEAAFYGATFVFTRNASGAYTQQARLVATGVIGRSPFTGLSISLSSSGDLLAMGAPFDDLSVGAVFIFKRGLNGSWTQTDKLVAPYPYYRTGEAVSLSAAGDMLAVSCPGWKIATGAVVIYRATAGGWVLQSKLNSPSLPYYSFFGTSMALSADGSTLVSTPDQQAAAGKLYVYKYNCTDWQLVATVPQDATLDNQHISSLAISSDGGVVAYGAFNDNNSTGAVVVLTAQSDGSYARVGSKLTARHAAPNSYLGESISMSADGRHLVVGAPGYPNVLMYAPGTPGPGAVWRFDACPDSSPPLPPQQSPCLGRPPKICTQAGFTSQCDDGSPCTHDRCVVRAGVPQGVCVYIQAFSGCKPCTQDSDCPDRNDCTRNRCSVNKWCTNNRLPVNSTCTARGGLPGLCNYNADGEYMCITPT